MSKNGYCIVCDKRASFGVGLPPTHCVRHAPDGMFNVTRARCIHDEHNGTEYHRRPSANYDNGTHCRQHANDKNNNYQAKCGENTPNGPCQSGPSYGKIGGKREKCNAHKTSEMVLLTKICLMVVKGKRCGISASFGYIEGAPTHCGTHGKELGMVCLTKHRCDHPSGCNITASYGAPGSPPHRCSSHKENFVRIYGLCEFPDCTKIASFNVEGEKPKFCVDHCDPETMVYINSRPCEVCGIQACFGMPDGKPRFCDNHKENGMVNIVHKPCIEPGCTTQVKYGPLFGPRLHCGAHHTKNEYIKNHPKCEFDGKDGTKCDKPYYTDDGTSYPVRCEKHQIVGKDVNIIEKKCVSCGMMNFIRHDTDKCGDCDAFAKSPPKKLKETKIKDAFDRANIKYESYDKRIEGGCSTKRPDFVIRANHFYIIVECDEDQHKTYPKDCELPRMFEIAESLSGNNCIFIRYNPDSYIDYQQKPQKPDDHRIGELVKMVNVLMLRDAPLPKPRVVMYMYYDGFGSDRIPIYELNYSKGTLSLVNTEW